jgi:hypothetical protein
MLVSAVSLSACGILDSEEPTAARLVLGGNSELPVQLVISSDFDILVDPETDERTVFLVTADTSTISAPFDQRYDLGSRKRIYLSLSSETVPTTPVSMKVFVGGDVQYDRQTDFDDEFLEFIYTVR